MTNIIFWGTSSFAIPSLEALVGGGHHVIGVVTNPDERVGRKLVLTPPPIKVLAEKHRIPVYQPAEKSALEYIKPQLSEGDLFVVAAYGKIIPNAVLALPRLGSINIHPSLLPRWRGPSPIQYTILYGDSEAGVTLMQVDELMDHGPIIAHAKYKIQNPKITYSELHNQLSNLGAKLLIDTIPKWTRRELHPRPQNDAEATFSKILKRDSGRIDWSRSARDIERAVRAFNPWPGTWTLWPSENKILRIKIEAADINDDEPPIGSPGFTWTNESAPLLVKTGDGNLLPTIITLAGKKPSSIKSFIHGHKKIIGDTLI